MGPSLVILLHVRQRGVLHDMSLHCAQEDLSAGVILAKTYFEHQRNKLLVTFRKLESPKACPTHHHLLLRLLYPASV